MFRLTLGEVERGEAGDNLLRLQRDGNDLADQAQDVVVVVIAVGIVDDAGAGGGGDAVLVDDPFQGETRQDSEGASTK